MSEIVPPHKAKVVAALHSLLQMRQLRQLEGERVEGISLSEGELAKVIRVTAGEVRVVIGSLNSKKGLLLSRETVAREAAIEGVVHTALKGRSIFPEDDWDVVGSTSESGREVERFFFKLSQEQVA